MKQYHTKYILSERQTKSRAKYLMTEKSKRVWKFYRPGDRTKSSSNKYVHNTIDGFSFVGIIEKLGADNTNTLPKFSQLFPIVITSRKCKRIEDLQETDFIGSYPYIKDKLSLTKELTAIYNNISDEFVTIYDVHYV